MCVVFFDLPEDNSQLYIRRLFVDYRHFDAAVGNITSRFEFRFGLSYTTFKHLGLSIDVVDGGEDLDPEQENNCFAGKTWLAGRWRIYFALAAPSGVQLTCRVSNSGDLEGIEVRILSFVYLRSTTSADSPLKKQIRNCTCTPPRGRANLRWSCAGLPMWIRGHAR